MTQKTAAFVVTIVLIFGLAASAYADPVMKAMEKELSRAKSLGDSGFDPPYFVSYSVYDSHDVGIEANFGGVINQFDRTSRRGLVEVRVGNYDLDNSGKGGMNDAWDTDDDFDRTHMFLRLPIENDEDAIRAQLWLVTDTIYKQAVSDYLRKKGKQVYLLDHGQKVDDYSKAKPIKHSSEPPKWDIDTETWRKRVKMAGSIFKNYPGITRGIVTANFHERTRRLVNTEGAEIIDGGTYFDFRCYAETRADDGQKLSNFFNVYARTESGLPSEKQILDGVKQMADDLENLRKAEKIDPYNGPAILDPTLAGVFFHEAVGHRLEGERQKNDEEGQTFKGKIGEKVLPEFISLYDDPTISNQMGTELNGHYNIDDEGVRSERVELIVDGIMKGFLLSRTPIEGFAKSNGHGRGDGQSDPMARMGNTIVTSKISVSAEAMKSKLIELAREQGKPYALILRHGQGGETATRKYHFQAFRNRPVLIYKVDVETGNETLVRGAEIVGTPLVSLNKVVVAGDDIGVFNGYCGAESGWVPVSVIAPSLLISELELQRTQDKPVKGPILPPPF
jgi:TldD protein